MADPRIYQQIEQTADLFNPDIYDLLTFHNSVFGTESDPITTGDTAYIPFTRAKLPNGTSILPFIIGLIPPSANITGRLVDRVTDPFAFGDTGFPQPVTAGSSLAPQIVAGEAPVFPVLLPRYTGKYKPYGNPAKDWPGQWANLGSFGVPHSKGDHHTHEGVDISCERGTPLIAISNAKVVQVTKESDPKNKNTAGGTTVRIQFDYQGKSWTAYYAHMEDVNVQVGDVLQQGDIVGTVGDSGNAKGTACHCHFELRQDGKAVDPLQYLVPANVAQGGPVNGDSNTSSWKQNGSKDAQSAQEAEAKAAGKKTTGVDTKASELNKKFLAAQRNMIRALQESVKQMAMTPPLKLLINPESFKVSNEKIISDGNWGRNGAGAGIEHWGNAQDKISASGKIAGFYALLNAKGPNGEGLGPGLTRAARNFSTAYANFLSMYLLYRNNGGIWIEDFADAKTGQTTKPNNLALVGSVYLYYDNTMYVGSFDSFEVTEDDTSPFTLSYSFDFTVRETFLLDRVGSENPDPAADYGLPAMFGQQSNQPPMTPTGTGPATVSPLAGGPVDLPPGTELA